MIFPGGTSAIRFLFNGYGRRWLLLVKGKTVKQRHLYIGRLLIGRWRRFLNTDNPGRVIPGESQQQVAGCIRAKLEVDDGRILGRTGVNIEIARHMRKSPLPRPPM